jgi:hypothetical protein
MTLFLFGVFTMIWFYVYNPYVIHYHEQAQLFRFDNLYFLSYLDRPGGLSEYADAFLTQFYFYSVAGAIILTAILTVVILLYHTICRTCGNTGQLFFIPFIPGVLLLMSFMNIHFEMSAALGILLALAGFKAYISLPLPVRYGAGLMLFTVLYFIAGGNALLLSVLMVIFELTDFRFQKKQIKKWDILYLLLLTAWSVFLPWIAWRSFYTITIREAYFAQTPANFSFSIIAAKILWISLSVLYLTGRLIAGKINQTNYSFQKAIVPNLLIVIFMTSYGAFLSYDRRENTVDRMSFELQRNNFDSVMALGKDYPVNDRLICYLTNIALAESGQMPSRMFHYRQVGVAGLFFDWRLSSVWYLGEIYYRLGMIPEAEHCAFEAMVSSPKEPNAKVLHRLTLTNIARRDSTTADKYLSYFDHSLFYRKWARQQRTNLAQAMVDSTFHIPDTPLPCHCKDFFIAYEVPEFTLLTLLEANPKHRMAFEYLMAYCMLQKDIEKTKWCMDNYYRNFDYPAIPAHYEEALLAYQNLMNKGDDFFTQYPVSQATRDRFNLYIQAFSALQGSKRKLDQFQKQFGDTYWYYLNFVEIHTSKK